MEFKCVSCEDWTWDKNKEEFENWVTCPNCDFPVKFTGWIESMQLEIRNLQKENTILITKLTAVLTVLQSSNQYQTQMEAEIMFKRIDKEGHT